MTVATVRSSQSPERVSDLTSYIGLKYSRVRDHYRPAPASLVRELGADKVVIAHPESFALLGGEADHIEVPCLVDFQNVLSRWFARMNQPEEQLKWQRIERDSLAGATAALVCSSEEMVALAAHGAKATISVARNGIAPDEWPPVERKPPDPPALAMFGSWWYPPNRWGAAWFCSEVWTRIIRDVPEARLLVAGRSEPPPELASAAGAQVVGPVADLASFFARATAIVVPIVKGPGTPMKFAESLASGTAVIATAEAAGGLTNLPAVISNEAAELAAGAVAVLSDPQLAIDLGQRGRTMAFDTLTWSRTQSALLDWVWSR